MKMRSSERWFTHGLLLWGSVLFILPFVWMLASSFKTDHEIRVEYPPRFLPREWHPENYLRLFGVAPPAPSDGPGAGFSKTAAAPTIPVVKDFPFARYLLNSLVITFFNVVGQVLVASLVGYAFARVRFRGKNVLFLLVLATMMLPQQVTMVPLFILYRGLGWIDTYKPLILPAFLGGLPFFIFLFRQFFLAIPREVDEAARIDGCSHLDIWWRILLPMARPAVATVAVLTFLWTWNDFLQPLIYLNSHELRTAALALSDFQTHHGESYLDLLMAASVVVLLPCLVLFFLAQVAFFRQIQVSATKG
jgi:multiple sugar transport system permease protein